MRFSKNVISDIEKHAEYEYPRECCGVIVVKNGKRRYVPCRNIASDGHFAIHPEDYANAEDMGSISTIVHSHPNVSPLPSQADLVGCEKSGIPWLIINWPTKKTHYFKPTNYVQQLYGREFSHGIIDCYTFIRDYYKQELDIILPDYARKDNWWLSGDNLYLDNIEDAGFYRVKELQKHDMIYMTVASQVPNHAAVYLGDNLIGHHQVNRLSSKDVYGGWYRKISTHIMRHKDA